jgi:dCTP diphosphatase
MALETLRQELRRLVDEREWDQFHSPKNLAINLMVEAAEIAEHFRWLSEEASSSLPDAQREEVGEEIGDVFMTLLLLADRLGLDVVDVTRKKLCKVAERYPADQSRGKCHKYTHYA